MRRFPLLLGLLVGCGENPAPPDATVRDGAVDATPDGAGDGGGACTFQGAGETPPEPARHTPRWAFLPWISKDISDRADTYAFVDGFRDRGIPVGAVVLDSPWETHYNTFIPSPTRYPDFGGMVRDLHGRGVRVVLWITALVNTRSYDLEPGGDTYRGASPNFEEGLQCAFYVNEGTTYPWWKGSGASVDFLNPRALAWWHRQQDPLYDLGVDGWKLDFGDSYVDGATVRTHAGAVPHQRYGEAYYRDFLAYGVQRRGRDFVTMVRGWDESYTFPGRFFARPEHAPVAWAGDNRRDQVGLADALDHMFRSAAAGYAVVGSDIGGYLDVDDRVLTERVAFSQDTFARWVAVGALSPFMQLHGRGNFAPWTVPERPDETVALYRYWATLHTALVPFWYALAEEAHRGGASVLRPVGPVGSWPGDYRYTLGEAFLVAPVLNDRGHRDVALPAGRWYDWWRPLGDALDGARTLPMVDTTDRTRIPVYVRAGAIVPLEVTNDVNGLGTSASSGALTVLLWPDERETTFTLRDDDTPRVFTLRRTPAGVTAQVPGLPRPTLLRVRADTPSRAPTVDGRALPELPSRAAFDSAPEGSWRDPATRSVWVKLPAASAERRVSLAPET